MPCTCTYHQHALQITFDSKTILVRFMYLKQTFDSHREHYGFFCNDHVQDHNPSRYKHQSYSPIRSHKTICNQASFFPKPVTIGPYYSILNSSWESLAGNTLISSQQLSANQSVTYYVICQRISRSIITNEIQNERSQD